ncbi:MAG: LysR substrate-binding domain-containing protein [Opitutaceae bacterium]|nr:LysR substrate-binding domain-containing protein [Opitutaceae bacterium]
MDLQLLRAFLLVVEHGSLNRAAERLQLAQSTLTRRMRALEHELGGPLFERGPSGVAPTAAGQLLERQLRPVLADLDRALGEVRKRARGQSAELRVGYLMSAVADYLNPALAALRRAHPEVKVRMLDLSPGEQMAALRRGEIDVALIGATGRLLSREFYVRRLARLPVLVALAETHPLAARKNLRFADLRDEHFTLRGRARIRRALPERLDLPPRAPLGLSRPLRPGRRQPHPRPAPRGHRGSRVLDS